MLVYLERNSDVDYYDDIKNILKQLDLDITIIEPHSIESLANIYLEIRLKDKVLEIIPSNKYLSDNKIFLQLPIKAVDLSTIICDSKKSFDTVLKLKNFYFSRHKQIIFDENHKYELTAKEAELIEFLIIKPDATVKEITKEIYSYSSDSDTHTLQTHIYAIRKKLGQDFITTTNIGYAIF